MENSLVSEFTDTCGHDLETSKVAFLESCSVGGGNFEKLPDILSVQVNSSRFYDSLLFISQNKTYKNYDSSKEEMINFFLC